MAISVTPPDLAEADALLDQLGNLFDGKPMTAVLLAIVGVGRYCAEQADAPVRAEFTSQLRCLADELEAADAVKH